MKLLFKNKFVFTVMVMLMLAFTFSCKLEVRAAEGDVEINEENFPDENFRKFIKSYPISENGFAGDYNGDGVLSADEIAKIKTLHIYVDVSSLKGIEYLTALERLSVNVEEQLTSLDVSKNSKLAYLDCSHNKNLSSLIIGKNSNLTFLNCEGNEKLDSLDVSGCSKLDTLRCSDCNIGSLDLSKNTELTVLYCVRSNLDSLNVNGCTKLKDINCNKNNLMSLDVSDCIALEKLRCAENKLNSLNVTKNSALLLIYLWDNEMESLDVSKCTSLQTLHCGSNKIDKLDVSQNKALTYLSCYENNLEALDVSQNTALTELNCMHNKIEKLDVSQNKALTSLDCYGNNLEALDVSQNIALTELNCSSNKIEKLDVSQNTALTELDFCSNKIDKLDVSQNKALLELDCRFNRLSSLDVGRNVELIALRCDGNKISSLDLSECTALELLWCYENHLSSLDISENKELKDLICFGNETTVQFKKTGFSIEGLDVERILGLEGAEIVGNLIVPDEGAKEITYLYDIKNNKFENPRFWLLPAAHEHDFGTEWKSDGESHWHECECGEKSDVSKHTLTSNVTPATFTKDGSIETQCSVCKQVTKTEVISSIKTVALSQSTYVYDGKAKNPVLKVQDSKGKTIAANYYTLRKAAGRKNVGKYTYKLTFKGNYKGTKTLTFVINPKGTKISKLVPVSKGFTVKWAKQNKQTTGYQIQYSLKPDMKGAKLVTVNKNTILTKTVNKLQANKKYYVQIRTYKTAGGKKYYSAWSKTGSVKTKR